MPARFPPAAARVRLVLACDLCTHTLPQHPNIMAVDLLASGLQELADLFTSVRDYFSGAQEAEEAPQQDESLAHHGEPQQQAATGPSEQREQQIDLQVEQLALEQAVLPVKMEQVRD